MFMIGDKVSYIGNKYKLSGKLGVVVSRVINQPDELVIEFDDSFVMHESLLTRYNPSQAKEKLDVEVRKKKPVDEPLIKEEKPKEMRDIFISDERTDYAD